MKTEFLSFCKLMGILFIGACILYGTNFIKKEYFMEQSKKRHECGLCKSWLVFVGTKCTNPNCPHYTKTKEKLILPEALGQLTNDEVSLLFTFLIEDGNLTSTAKLLETTKYHIKERLKILKGKIEVFVREKEILTNYIDKNIN